MKVQNKVGPAVIGEPADPVEYTAKDLASQLEADRVIFVDTRHNRLVHDGTVEGALNLPGAYKAASYGAWVHNPALCDGQDST